MKRIYALVVALVLLLALAPASFAQTTINTTTLSTAISTPTPNTNATNQVTLASLGSGSTAVAVGNILFIDMEAMRVTALPSSGTTVTVARNQIATRATPHASNAIVYYGPSVGFVSGQAGVQYYSGACTSTNFATSPVVDVINGTVGNCLDSRWSWTKLAAPFGTVRPYHAVVDAAYTVKITDEIIGVTSLTSGRTITLPAATGLAGKYYVIQDESGSAGTSTATITISPNLNGGNLAQTITTGFGAIVVRSNGSTWLKQ